MKKLLVLTMLLILALGLFASEKLDKLTSVEVKDSTIVATYTIPEGMHMFLQKDFFYLDVDEMEGVVFGETVYPEGHADEDGYISLVGTVQLTKKFTLKEGVELDDMNVKIYVGYQMCFDSYCEPPVDLEATIPLKESVETTIEKVISVPAKTETEK